MKDDDFPKITGTNIGQPLLVQFAAGQEPVPVRCPRCKAPQIFDLSLMLRIAFVMAKGIESKPAQAFFDGLAEGEVPCLDCSSYDLASKASEPPKSVKVTCPSCGASYYSDPFGPYKCLKCGEEWQG